MDAVDECSRRHPCKPHVCLAENGPLTNRISTHFARIKAVPRQVANHGYCARIDHEVRTFRKWTLTRRRRRRSGDVEGDAQETSKATLRRRRRRRSGDVEGDAQETSKATLRRRRRRRSGDVEGDA